MVLEEMPKRTRPTPCSQGAHSLGMKKGRLQKIMTLDKGAMFRSKERGTKVKGVIKSSRSNQERKHKAADLEAGT